MLRGGKGSEHLSTSNVQESSRNLHDKPAQIKYRYNTFDCLTAVPFGKAGFKTCGGKWQHWILQGSFLINDDDRSFCLQYIDDSTLLLLKCEFGRNNPQRWAYTSFLRFQSFEDIDKCMEYADGDAEMDKCDDFKKAQGFLFRYD